MSTPVLETASLSELTMISLEDFEQYEEPTDKNTKAHIVNPPKNLHIWQDGMTTQEMVDIARLTQQKLEALCGYRWIPKHNPDKFDVCEQCMHIAQQMMSEDGE